ncbi:MAG TPA: hypothetical protein VGB00_05880 [Pyrinomonadaceae bacterium]|jgi:hypothetical protein
MADKTTKTGNANFIRNTNDKFTAGQNTPSGEDMECDGLDEELKSIFDDLRAVGSPQEYSLDEVLIKAIGAEKELSENKVKISSGKPAFGMFGENRKSGAKQILKIWDVELQFQVATLLLLTLGSIYLVFILPLKGQEVTKHFREIQAQVIK